MNDQKTINTTNDSKPMSYQAYQEAKKSVQKLPDDKYITADISDELWREVITSGGLTMRINNPVTLIIRKGGSTHRVIDADKEVYCYAAPETGHSIIKWKAREGKADVLF